MSDRRSVNSPLSVPTIRHIIYAEPDQRQTFGRDSIHPNNLSLTISLINSNEMRKYP